MAPSSRACSRRSTASSSTRRHATACCSRPTSTTPSATSRTSSRCSARSRETSTSSSPAGPTASAPRSKRASSRSWKTSPISPTSRASTTASARIRRAPPSRATCEPGSTPPMTRPAASISRSTARTSMRGSRRGRSWSRRASSSLIPRASRSWCRARCSMPAPSGSCASSTSRRFTASKRAAASSCSSRRPSAGRNPHRPTRRTEGNMFEWVAQTLRSYPEIALFLSLGIGYYVGKFTFKGIGLGAVTATLLAAVVIGQLGITISPNVKSTFFLIFLFAVGYGVGPQFVRGVARDGLPQAVFAAVQCVFCLVVGAVVARLAGYDLGYAAGLYAGSQTISASMGLATDAINRLGLPADQAKALLDSMPIAYAVTYMFGTMGSAMVIAIIGPKLLGINLVAACKDYEEKHGGGKKQLGGPGTAWTRWALRAYKVQPGGKAVGLRVAEAESLVPDARLFILRIRRGGEIMDATADTVLKEGDVVAVVGPRDVLLNVLGAATQEVEDRELLAVPVEGVDVLVTNKQVDGKTLEELATRPAARGVFLRKITRGATATDIPILPSTEVNRGDLLTLVGRTEDIAAATKMLGVADRPTDVTDMAFVGAAIVVGALVGALVFKVAGVPLTLSTAGGALIAGIIGGWLRSVRPSFGRIPTPTVWFMNSVGLNIFIAIVGISAGPGFVDGLKTQGIGLFLWGALATTVPLILGMFVAKYVFRFHDALNLGIISGSRTTTASLGLVCDQAKSQIPALGYTVTYAVGNTLLTIWGMIIIMLLS